MRDATPDHYDALGLPRTASARQLKSAYRRLAKECHPDRHPGDPVAEERFKALNAAYAVLGDKRLRADYDRLHPAAGKFIPPATPAAPDAAQPPRPYTAARPVRLPYTPEELAQDSARRRTRRRRELILGVCCLFAAFGAQAGCASDEYRYPSYLRLRPVPLLLLSTAAYFLVIKPAISKGM